MYKKELYSKDSLFLSALIECLPFREAGIILAIFLFLFIFKNFSYTHMVFLSGNECTVDK